MYVVLCRGDLNEAELQVFGPFDEYQAAKQWLDEASTCPNKHEMKQVKGEGKSSLVEMPECFDDNCPRCQAYLEYVND
jgi:hypothetical protein